MRGAKKRLERLEAAYSAPYEIPPELERYFAVLEVEPSELMKEE